MTMPFCKKHPNVRLRKLVGCVLCGTPPPVATPIAWVPIHPRIGPLWANTITSMESDHPRSYEMMPLYAGPSVETPAPPRPLICTDCGWEITLGSHGGDCPQRAAVSEVSSRG